MLQPFEVLADRRFRHLKSGGKIAHAGRAFLLYPVEDAAAAFWAAAHGVTTLLVSGFVPPDAPMIALVREAILEHIDDLEDYFLAEARARKNRKTISLEDVERELGLAN